MAILSLKTLFYLSLCTSIFDATKYGDGTKDGAPPTQAKLYNANLGTHNNHMRAHLPIANNYKIQQQGDTGVYKVNRTSVPVQKPAVDHTIPKFNINFGHFEAQIPPIKVPPVIKNILDYKSPNSNSMMAKVEVPNPITNLANAFIAKYGKEIAIPTIHSECYKDATTFNVMHAIGVAVAGVNTVAGILGQGKFLGKGAFGEVNEVPWSVGGNQVQIAVKTMKIRQHMSAMETLKSELKFMFNKGLTGANQAIACYQEGDKLHVFMPKMDFDLTYSEFKTTFNKLSEEERIVEGIKILALIENIHSHKIVHGDLKPENIMFSKARNEYKLIDFGLSGLVGSPISGGSPLYFSPQKTLAGAVNLYNDDIWAFVLIFAEFNSHINDLYAGTNMKCIFNTFRVRLDPKCVIHVKEVIMRKLKNYKKELRDLMAEVLDGNKENAHSATKLIEDMKKIYNIKSDTNDIRMSVQASMTQTQAKFDTPDTMMRKYDYIVDKEVKKIREGDNIIKQPLRLSTYTKVITESSKMDSEQPFAKVVVDVLKKEGNKDFETAFFERNEYDDIVDYGRRHSVKPIPAEMQRVIINEEIRRSITGRPNVEAKRQVSHSEVRGGQANMRKHLTNSYDLLADLKAQRVGAKQETAAQPQTLHAPSRPKLIQNNLDQVPRKANNVQLITAATLKPQHFQQPITNNYTGARPNANTYKPIPKAGPPTIHYYGTNTHIEAAKPYEPKPLTKRLADMEIDRQQEKVKKIIEDIKKRNEAQQPGNNYRPIFGNAPKDTALGRRIENLMKPNVNKPVDTFDRQMRETPKFGNRKIEDNAVDRAYRNPRDSYNELMKYAAGANKPTLTEQVLGNNRLHGKPAANTLNYIGRNAGGNYDRPSDQKYKGDLHKFTI